MHWARIKRNFFLWGGKIMTKTKEKVVRMSLTLWRFQPNLIWGTKPETWSKSTLTNLFLRFLLRTYERDSFCWVPTWKELHEILFQIKLNTCYELLIVKLGENARKVILWWVQYNGKCHDTCFIRLKLMLNAAAFSMIETRLKTIWRFLGTNLLLGGGR